MTNIIYFVNPAASFMVPPAPRPTTRFGPTASSFPPSKVSSLSKVGVDPSLVSRGLHCSPRLAPMSAVLKPQLFSAVYDFGHGMPLPMPAAPVATATAMEPKPVQSTGVYYNNYELKQPLHPFHPFQIRDNKAAISPEQPLPIGKPMPQPPALAPASLVDNSNFATTTTAAASVGVSTSVKPNQPRDNNNYDDSDDEVQVIEKPVERKRKRSDSEVTVPSANTTSKKRFTEDPANKDNKDAETFIEAAFALSELASVARLKPSPAASPKSVMQALPPPPFFLPSARLE